MLAISTDVIKYLIYHIAIGLVTNTVLATKVRHVTAVVRRASAVRLSMFLPPTILLSVCVLGGRRSHPALVFRSG